jgi:hypothetical protein
MIACMGGGIGAARLCRALVHLGLANDLPGRLGATRVAHA